ncbi:hypothetical protein NS365_05315 [Aureimonas ureilytica]|uniref:Nitroreductase domain-containing protein n=1 Tax=Aureimonas ureilytica TaxID=401562 RepID=A0A175RUF5_9HYPH|nr:nitroreductase family protein [Aureimonas ureilytica]KTR07063.1 hypothetical protein NS365_05315 [Aureimonas ureilytica]
MSQTILAEPTLHPLLASRRSPRAFASLPVPNDVVATLFEAARWAPSANNLQPWAFAHGARGTDAFDGLASCLTDTNAVWATQAPLLILALERPLKPDGTPHPHARYDLGQAVAHLTLQASALDLHVHQMAGFDAERVRTVAAIPPDLVPVTVIAVGYLGAPESLPPALHERERAPRSRKPLDEIVVTAIGGADGAGDW